MKLLQLFLQCVLNWAELIRLIKLWAWIFKNESIQFINKFGFLLFVWTHCKANRIYWWNYTCLDRSWPNPIAVEIGKQLYHPSIHTFTAHVRTFSQKKKTRFQIRVDEDLPWNVFGKENGTFNWKSYLRRKRRGHFNLKFWRTLTHISSIVLNALGR